MKPAPFEYHPPKTVDEIANLLATLENAKILVGGQSLMPMLNMRFVICDHVIDLNAIGELVYIHEEKGELRIGTLTRQRDIELSPLVAEQNIKEGKNAVTWTRLSCTRFAANAMWLQLHALAYNLANFMRTLALPDEVKHWSLTMPRGRLAKIGAKIVRHGGSITFQVADVMVPRALFRQILAAIAVPRPEAPDRC